MTISGIWGVHLLLRHPRRRRLIRMARSWIQWTPSCCDSVTLQLERWNSFGLYFTRCGALKIWKRLWRSPFMLPQGACVLKLQCEAISLGTWHAWFTCVQPPKSQKVSRMVSTPSTSGYHRLPPSTPTLPALLLQPKRFAEDLQWPEACPASPMQEEYISENWVVDTAKILHVFVFVIEPQVHRLCIDLAEKRPKNSLVTGQVAENTEKQALQMLERRLDSALKRGQTATKHQNSSYIHTLFV